MADSRAEQVHVSPTALAQTSALLTEDRDERTAQARQTTRKRLLNTTDLFEQLRKLTGSGASGIPPYTMRRAEVPPHRLTYIRCAVASGSEERFGSCVFVVLAPCFLR